MSNTAEQIIEVKNLKKTFDTRSVVDNISFSVTAGSLFAFLGKNGAGKTTTINMIIGMLQRDGGEILYKGSTNFASFKNKIGVVFQNNILDDLLTVEENLQLYGMLYMESKAQMKIRMDEVVKLLALNDIVKQRFSTLSGGQKRKVEIARALFCSPEILFLDEPTTGLDPKTRAEIWQITNKLKNETGMTIFLTTHYMEETAAADKVVIIDKGKIIATGSPAELKKKHAFDKMLITPKDINLLENQLKKVGFKWTKTADTYTVAAGTAAESIKFLTQIKGNVSSYEVISGSMDDVFLSVVGERSGGHDE